jgi:serine/threonine-protein kinase RsbT
VTAEARSIRVRVESDAAEASRAARELAASLGFGATDVVQVATAVSEVAANQVQHAAGGTVVLSRLEGERGPGVLVEAADDGPGIDRPERALEDGFSTRGSLGLGLPGARRLMDEFQIESAPGQGTHVRMVKWRTARPAAPGRLAAWTVAGAGEAVVRSFATGLLLAVGRGAVAAVLRAEPALAPAAALHAAPGADAVVASFSGLDGHLAWMRAGTGAGVLLRRRGAAVSVVAEAPARRAQTLGVRRGDVLLLASSGPLVPLGGDDPGELAAAAVAAGAQTALAARLLRGVLERRGA